jgi:hypothetical protein
MLALRFLWSSYAGGIMRDALSSAMKLSVLAAVVISAGFAGCYQADASFLAVSIGEIPFGPFHPNDTVTITGTATNISPDQSISICEGVCVGDTDTFSLGASAFTPTATVADYSFLFGNGGDTSIGFLDGQLAGILDPGQTKTFTFGEYVPKGGFASPGFYGFGPLQLQIFCGDSGSPIP